MALWIPAFAGMTVKAGSRRFAKEAVVFVHDGEVVVVQWNGREPYKVVGMWASGANPLAQTRRP